MIKVGIVGSGNMGGVHAAAWKATHAQFVGITSEEPERDREIASVYGGRRYESFDSLLDAVDVIDICTPTHMHHDMILRAAAAKKQIVCEKPLARTYAQGAEAVDACKAAGVQLLIAHVVRFFPEYARAQQIVQRGEIGDVAVVRLTRCAFQPRVAPDSWFMDPAKSGGMLLDLMIHDFDYARWVAGDVVSVYARSVRGREPGAGEDYALAILKHANGAISNIEGAWAYPAPMFRTALEIAGSGGLIEHPADSSTPIGIYKKAQAVGDVPEVGLPLSPLAEDPYTTEIKHFYDVLVNGTTPRVTAEDALAALRIALAATESASSGRAVEI
jgi:predicted dehydrogenase